MTDEDTFVHSILANPDDDLPRLVFADWLEEHGRESHAELIRLQCELVRMPQRSKQAAVNARRKKLAAREKVLLARPEFQATWPAGVPEPPYEGFKRIRGYPEVKYDRGFLGRQRVGDGELMAPEWPVSPWNRLLREGKLLALEIEPGQGGFQTGSFLIAYDMADLAEHPALNRVTKIYIFEGNISDDNLGLLARSPLLTQLRELWLCDCDIHLSAIEALLTSPSVTKLQTLLIDSFYIAGARRAEKKGLRLWQLVASSPNMASLERLYLRPPLGGLESKAVEALIQSPYLKESLRLDMEVHGKRVGASVREQLATLKPTLVKAFRQRFSACRF